jgi:hypothetical protein
VVKHVGIWKTTKKVIKMAEGLICFTATGLAIIGGSFCGWVLAQILFHTVFRALDWWNRK